MTTEKELSALHQALLEPIISDRALMAMVRLRNVPFYFVLKYICKRSTVEDAANLVDALQAMRPENGGSFGGVVGLDVRFYLVGEVLQISAADLADSRGFTEVSEVTTKHLSDALGQRSKSSAAEFRAKRYNVLKEESDLYERVLKECSNVTNLADALAKVRLHGEPMEKREYERIKAAMNRCGLMREPVFAQNVLINGMHVYELQQRYIGQKLENVLPLIIAEHIAKERQTVNR